MKFIGWCKIIESACVPLLIQVFHYVHIREVLATPPLRLQQQRRQQQTVCLHQWRHRPSGTVARASQCCNVKVVWMVKTSPMHKIVYVNFGCMRNWHVLTEWRQVNFTFVYFTLIGQQLSKLRLGLVSDDVNTWTRNLQINQIYQLLTTRNYTAIILLKCWLYLIASYLFGSQVYVCDATQTIGKETLLIQYCLLVARGTCNHTQS